MRVERKIDSPSKRKPFKIDSKADALESMDVKKKTKKLLKNKEINSNKAIKLHDRIDLDFQSKYSLFKGIDQGVRNSQTKLEKLIHPSKKLNSQYFGRRMLSDDLIQQTVDHYTKLYRKTCEIGKKHSKTNFQTIKGGKTLKERKGEGKSLHKRNFKSIGNLQMLLNKSKSKKANINFKDMVNNYRKRGNEFSDKSSVLRC